MSKVVTGTATRWSYVNVFKPKKVGTDENSPEKYSVLLLIPKTDAKTVEAVKDAIKTAYDEGVDILKGKNPTAPALLSKAIKYPLRDGDEEHPGDPVYEGHYFVNAKSSDKPGIVDVYKNPITDESLVYSGCYGRASISFYAFSFNGNKGIGCGLNNLMKVKDGERLGGKASAEDDFAAYDDSEEAADFM